MAIGPTPSDVGRRILDLAFEGIDGTSPPPAFPSDPFWKGLRSLGTELWLDTGDLDAAGRIWTSEFSALTTNNTLLNSEVQKGIYDDLIRKAAREVTGLDTEAMVAEIGFLLNVRHGLRLARAFGARVSVELHTSLAHDVQGAVAYGRRFHEASPDRFIVKVPLTSAGLLAARQLRSEGIPVNFTLGFSARQNYLAARFAGPSYVNVFLGRLGSYVVENRLGDGVMVGERATLASQRAVEEVSRDRKEPVLQIAASLRDPAQVASLAGVDVFTVPIKVAAGARKTLDGKWISRRGERPVTALSPGIDPREVRLDVLWDISDADRMLADDLCARPPRSGDEIVGRAREAGAADLFPQLPAGDLERIAREGKIPHHETWKARIARGELAIDSLLNLAGLASFTESQRELDDRIRRFLR